MGKINKKLLHSVNWIFKCQKWKPETRKKNGRNK